MKYNVLKSFGKLLPFSLLTLVYSCKKSDFQDSGNPQFSSGVSADQLTSPTTINLLPGQNPQTKSRRIFLPISQVGSNNVNLKMVFDTGSEGLVFQATAVLPLELVADTGIVIKDRDSLIVNGITVTRAKVKSIYGDGADKRTFNGNIAYANIRIGDGSGNVRTKRMPFVVIYKGVYDDTQVSVPVDKNSDGIAGVYSSGDPIPGLVTKRGDIKSPFGYLNLAPGLHAGFTLAPLSYINWDNVTDYTSTPGQPLLTIGLDDQSRGGFTVQAQKPATAGFFPNLHATVLEQNAAPAKLAILLDTGTPRGNELFLQIPAPTRIFTSDPVSFNTPEGFSYSYIPDAGYNITRLLPLPPNPAREAIYGINFFLENAFQLDYTAHTIGLQAQ